MADLRTPTTPDNKYKRIGLAFLGFACIIAGVIILVSSCHNSDADQSSHIPDTAKYQVIDTFYGIDL